EEGSWDIRESNDEEEMSVEMGSDSSSLKLCNKGDKLEVQRLMNHNSNSSRCSDCIDPIFSFNCVFTQRREVS
ncbi:hypothetical protein GWI33_007737, partial [Rhynchophorus ferrugineus]